LRDAELPSGPEIEARPEVGGGEGYGLSGVAVGRGWSDGRRWGRERLQLTDICLSAAPVVTSASRRSRCSTETTLSGASECRAQPIWLITISLATVHHPFNSEQDSQGCILPEYAFHREMCVSLRQ
jgi:hypothetical protein